MGLVRIHVHPRMQGIQRCMGTILYVYIYSIYVHMYRYTLYYVHGECRQLLIIQTLYTACNRKIVSHAMCYIYKVMYICLRYILIQHISMKTSPPKVAQPYYNIHSLCTQRCIHNADDEYHTIRPTRRWNTLAAKRGLINKAH